MLHSFEWLSERVSNLFSCVSSFYINIIGLNCFPSEMILNFNVLRTIADSFFVDFGKIDSTVIVNHNSDWLCRLDLTRGFFPVGTTGNAFRFA